MATCSTMVLQPTGLRYCNNGVALRFIPARRPGTRAQRARRRLARGRAARRRQIVPRARRRGGSSRTSSLAIARRRVRRDRRRVGRRQVDAAEHHRRPRARRRRHGRSSTASTTRTRRRGADRACAATRMGFVFQAFHVLPYLSVARERRAAARACRERDADANVARRRDARRGRPRAVARRARRASFPAASCSASRSRARSCTGRRSCSPTSRPATSIRDTRRAGDRAAARRSEGSGAAAVLATHSRMRGRFCRSRLPAHDGRAARRVAGATSNDDVRGDRLAVARAVTGGAACARCAAARCSPIVAIAFGIALGYAVELINRAAVGELTAGLAVLSGDADLEVRGPRAGFDETLYPVLAKDHDVAVASPVVEVDVQARRSRRTARACSASMCSAPRRSTRRSSRWPAIVSMHCKATRSFRATPPPRWLGAGPGNIVLAQAGLDALPLRVAGYAGASGGARYAVMDIAAVQDHFRSRWTADANRPAPS